MLQEESKSGENRRILLFLHIMNENPIIYRK
jgi:hypothetical protein